MDERMDETNVTREGKAIKCKRAYVTGAKADFAKRVVKLSVEITLDESSFAVRDDLAFWSYDKTPIQMTLKPVQQQLGFPMPGGVESVTLSAGGKSVALGEPGELEDGDDQDS